MISRDIQTLYSYALYPRRGTRAGGRRRMGAWWSSPPSWCVAEPNFPLVLSPRWRKFSGDRLLPRGVKENSPGGGETSVLACSSWAMDDGWLRSDPQWFVHRSPGCVVVPYFSALHIDSSVRSTVCTCLMGQSQEVTAAGLAYCHHTRSSVGILTCGIEA